MSVVPGSRFRMRVLAVSASLALGMVAPTSALDADTQAIDVDRSTLRVFAYKSGLFSAFADDHVVRAPIASGSLSADPPLSVEIRIRAGDLEVLDPGMAASKRAQVQTRMLGPEVLDTAKYPEIAFSSTAIEPAGAGRWAVTGQLALHGVTRPVTFSVAATDGRYRGTALLRQRDFGIQPISIVGGTVKVKDELKVEFDIVTRR